MHIPHIHTKSASLRCFVVPIFCQFSKWLLKFLTQHIWHILNQPLGSTANEYMKEARIERNTRWQKIIRYWKKRRKRGSIICRNQYCERNRCYYHKILASSESFIFLIFFCNGIFIPCTNMNIAFNIQFQQKKKSSIFFFLPFAQYFWVIHGIYVSFILVLSDLFDSAAKKIFTSNPSIW